jgi:hypothetical protein
MAGCVKSAAREALMGHLYPKNLSELMHTMAVINDGVTGNEVIDEAIERGELVECAEAAYDDRHMYEFAILDLLFYYDQMEYVEWKEPVEELSRETRGQWLNTSFRFMVKMTWREGAVYCSRHIEHIEH